MIVSAILSLELIPLLGIVHKGLLYRAYFSMDLYFTNSSIFWISQIYFSRIVAEFMHVRDQPLTLCGSIFHELCSYNLEISEI